MNSRQIKERMYQLGADLCGIASIDRFDAAPEGFHPSDVLPDCKSVIVFMKRFLSGTLACNSTVPYTIVRNMLSYQLDIMSVQLCADLEEEGIVAVPTGTIAPTEYDTKTKRFRNIISAKHAAQAAGLGTIGKNTLLITPEYGNMVWISVVLTEMDLEPDPLMKTNLCNDCDLCITVCPVHAIGDPELNQTACSEYAFGGENGGEWKIKCHACRDICPFCFGTKNKK